MPRNLEALGYAFDLFGTLAIPPDRKKLEARIREHSIFSREAMQGASTGFPAALLAEEVGFPIADARKAFLTRPFENNEEFLSYLLAVAPRPSAVQTSTVSLVDELTDMVLAGTTPAYQCRELLDHLSFAGFALQLVSNVSSVFAATIELLGLDRWFPKPTLSFEIGECKQSGSAFGRLAEGNVPNWYVVGDSWRSDILPAIQAGHGAIFIDVTGTHVARMIVRDARQLLILEEGTGRIVFDGQYKPAIDGFLPLPCREIEADPGKQLVGRIDGTIGLLCLEQVRVIDKISGLIPLR